MTMIHKHKALICLLAVILVSAVSIYLTIIGVLPFFALIALLFGCHPWYKYIWNSYNIERRNTTKILKRILPQSGFLIEHEEWDEKHSQLQFVGKFNEEHFMIEASPNSPYINVYDLTWNRINASDPSMHRFVEAVNDTNAINPNMSVIVCDPDEENLRYIHTISKTILPDYRPHEYLECLMSSMLECKGTLIECFNRDRPWLNAKRGPIGFNTSQNHDNDDNAINTGFAATAKQTES